MRKFLFISVVGCAVLPLAFAAISVSASAQTTSGTHNALEKSKPKSSTARIVEDVPSPQEHLHKNMIHVRAAKTPSGFRVPRYVSLKYGTSNGRTGPSRGHPVAWRYKRRGMPMVVVAETEVWRKVRDVNGDETWMNRRLLDGTRMVLARTEIILRAKPKSDSRQRVIAAKGALLELEECDAQGWCLVRERDGHRSGYALQTLLWGAEPL